MGGIEIEFCVAKAVLLTPKNRAFPASFFLAIPDICGKVLRCCGDPLSLRSEGNAATVEHLVFVVASRRVCACARVVFAGLAGASWVQAKDCVGLNALVRMGLSAFLCVGALRPAWVFSRLVSYLIRRPNRSAPSSTGHEGYAKTSRRVRRPSSPLQKVWHGLPARVFTGKMPVPHRNN